MISEVFGYKFNKKSDLVDLTAVAFLGVMKQNKRITRMSIRCDNKHNLSFYYLG